MSVTMEVLGRVIRVVDTDKGILAELPIIVSQTVTKWRHIYDTLAGLASDSSINLGGITAAKVLLIVTSGEASYKLNGGTTAIPCENIGFHVTSDGDITGLTMSNPGASDITYNILVGG